MTDMSAMIMSGVDWKLASANVPTWTSGPTTTPLIVAYCVVFESRSDWLRRLACACATRACALASDLHLRLVHPRLGGFHRSVGGVVAGLRRVVDRARDDVTLDEVGVALHLDLGDVALDLRALQVGLRREECGARAADRVLGRGDDRALVLHLGLVGAQRGLLHRGLRGDLRRVNAHERLALRHLLALRHVHVRDAARDLRRQVDELNRADFAVGGDFRFE
jgi:hypothetical protein